MTRGTGVVIFSLLFCIPVVGQNEGVDIRLFRSINGLQNPSQNGFFEYLDHSSIPTFGATPLGFIVVGAAVKERTTTEAGVLAAVSQLTAFGLTIGLKELIGRHRPFEELSDVKVKHLWSVRGSSFPSGHASQAFTLATILSLQYRKVTLTIPLFLWATAIGYSRVYLGVHYPSDVLAGAAVGLASAAAIWSVRKRLSSLNESLSGEPSTNVLVGDGDLDLIRLEIPLPGW
ncbi:MAG: phosphatase PAP2 family protein [Ignavibacteriales bacterium]|nr:phosphatase PAP2 family protein [Ignavibacteriales bacterium]